MTDLLASLITALLLSCALATPAIAADECQRKCSFAANFVAKADAFSCAKTLVEVKRGCNDAAVAIAGGCPGSASQCRKDASSFVKECIRPARPIARACVKHAKVVRATTKAACAPCP